MMNPFGTTYSRPTGAIPSILCALALATPGHADTFQWAGTASGNWSAPSSWSLGLVPPVGGSTTTSLIFGSPSTSNYNATNDLAGVFTLNHLTFDNNTNAVIQVRSASGSGIAFDGPNATFDFTGLGSQTFANVSGGLGIALNSNLSLNMLSYGSLTISAPISGTGGITIEGTELASNVGVIGITAGSGQNTFSGGVTLNSGNLYLTGSTATASPLGTGPLTINGGNIGFGSATTRINVPVVVNSDLVISRGTGTINGDITYNNAGANLESYGGSLNLNVASNHTGATILGGRDTYAASTGPAAITLSTNGTTHGTLLSTSGIQLLAGAALNIENASANIQDRVGDAVPIEMSSGTISLRANSAGTTEALGDVSFSGYCTLEARPASGAPYGAGTLVANSLDRVDHGVLYLRGQNLGVPTEPPAAATKYAEIKVAGAAPALAGGGGSAGSTDISIVPYAVAAYSTTSSTTTYPNTLATYDPVTGFRPLNPATEFAGALGSDPTENVRLTALSTNNDDPVSVNSVVLSSNSSVSITGTGTISVASGAVLASVLGAASTISNDMSFGSAEAVVTTTGPLRITGDLTGTSGLTKSGNFQLELTGDNSGLTGPLTINGASGSGGSRIDIGNELSLPGSGPIHVYSAATTAAAGIGVSNFLSGDSAPITVSRPIVTHSGLTAIDTRNSSTDGLFTGDISGDGSICINSSGSWGLIELTGNNTYKGITRLHAGVLRIHSDANLGDGGALVLATAVPNQGLELAGDWTTSRTIHTLYETGVNTMAYDAILNGPLTGSSDISKYGVGALVINADSPYTGEISVLDGSVFVNAITGATITTYDSIFGGTGRVGDVDMLGLLVPGSPDQPQAELSMSSLLIYAPSVVAFDLGPAGDLVTIDNALTTNLSFGSAVTFAFNSLGGIQAGGVYDLAHFASTNALVSDFAYVSSTGLTGEFVLSANALQFHVFEVPGPATALVFPACAALGLRRRRR